MKGWLYTTFCVYTCYWMSIWLKICYYYYDADWDLNRSIVCFSGLFNYTSFLFEGWHEKHYFWYFIYCVNKEIFSSDNPWMEIWMLFHSRPATVWLQWLSAWYFLKSVAGLLRRSDWLKHLSRSAIHREVKITLHDCCTRFWCWGCLS